MSDDHLSNEISVSAELTPTGVKAAAKSRLLSSVDRLAGGIIDIWNASVENVAKRQRARGHADIQIIEAAAQLRLEQLHQNPEIAAAIWDQHLKKVGRRTENKAKVVTLAIEDLRRAPPTDDQSTTGADSLEEAFLDRFERYAEDATTDQLRERWGRILAAEIRTPGVFSGKVLRVVDELDSTTAHIFEKFCTNRIGKYVPRCLTSLSYTDELLLVSAELLTDPGMGQMTPSGTGKIKGEQVHVIRLSDYAIAFPAEVKIPHTFETNEALVSNEDSIAASVYILTDSGNALASILESDERRVALSFAEATAKQIAGNEVLVFDVNVAGSPQIASFQDARP